MGKLPVIYWSQKFSDPKREIHFKIGSNIPTILQRFQQGFILACKKTYLLFTTGNGFWYAADKNVDFFAYCRSHYEAVPISEPLMLKLDPLWKGIERNTFARLKKSMVFWVETGNIFPQV